MRIFVAGATGALGRRLVPALLAAGHQVCGSTRSPQNAQWLREVGAEPVVLDPLDREAVAAAVAAARPEVVMHQLTALGAISGSLKRFDQEFAQTNRLRTEGLDHLLAAAVAAGARRFIAQSFAGWPGQRTGPAVQTEQDPLDPTPAAESRQTHAAIRYLEAAVTGADRIEPVVLRYGLFYGPGSAFAADGVICQLVRQRKLPVVGGGTGIWSFLHLDDAAAATVAAVTGSPGTYHVVDDEPAQVAEWLPYLASVLGAKPPRRVPAWLVRPMLGEHGVSMMTAIRGASNARARRELDWTMRYPSWRQGFPAVVRASSP